MGILNCTPDSFSDGEPYSCDRLVERGLKMVGEGADIIDIGGESTRPGAFAVDVEQEMRRVIPVIEGLRKSKPQITISIDTTKASVAKRAVQSGATLINDVSALMRDEEMAEVVREFKTQVILMHHRGTPQTMSSLTEYSEGVNTILKEMRSFVDRALARGIVREQILIDPGFGFAKTSGQNLELLKNTSRFKEMGFPVVIGLSRKRFVGELINEEDPKKRDEISHLLHFYSLLKGASVIRAHDVYGVRVVRFIFNHLS